MANTFKWPFPELPPDEGSFHTCQFSVAWLPVVISVLQTMNNPNTWEDPPDDFLDQVGQLLDMILTDIG